MRELVTIVRITLKKRKLNFKIAQNCLKYVYNLFGVDYEIKSFHQ